MFSMPGMPVTCCSMGAATVSATTWALAPGYWIDTCTPGGVIRGYCASGKVKRAMPPISVITTDRTVAKIGRSMKNREIMNAPRKLLGRLFGRLRGWSGAGVGRPQCRHEDFILACDGHSWPDLLQRAHHNPVVRLEPVDNAQAVFLERSCRH